MRALSLQANQPPRFYRGGPRIAALRGIPPGEDHLPGGLGGINHHDVRHHRRGVEYPEDGRRLRDAVIAQPEAFPGPEHVELRPNPALLVKLLDAGERLPVHVHPGRDFARRQLGSRSGKTEAWRIVSAEPGAHVYIGFRDDVEAGVLRGWVDRNDASALLGALHEWPVCAGDVVFVPAGTPHAIGEGILLVELQEPTDFSIMLEQPVAGGLQPELGLGWNVAGVYGAVSAVRCRPPDAAAGEGTW